MIAAVTGSRHNTDREGVFRVLDQLNDGTLFLTQLVVGDALGVDAHARAWARSRGIPLTEWKADWERYGPAAGPLRNKMMLNTPGLGRLIAFPGGRGTDNCVRQAELKGLPITRILPPLES